MTLVFGGSASGKSAYAERLVMAYPGKKIYLATMEPYGKAAEERIAKHVAMRAGKGFETMECTDAEAFSKLSVDGAVVLLEDLPNLVANGLFAKEGQSPQAVYAAVVEGIGALATRAAELVIVTGDLASDGCCYDETTLAYLKLLGQLQVYLGKQADAVTEVVAGCPIVIKE